jgi:parallel beta-helix repeat protein
MRHLVFGVVFLVLAIPCAARVITVDDDGPADFNNIQAAIDDSNNGDVVVVFPGIYTGAGNRDIDFLGKVIVVRSVNPDNPSVVAATVIDCNGTEEEEHRGFYFHSGEDHNSILEGFTITNGFYGNGGGIRCDGSSPTIRKNVITGNETEYDGDGGGGIACWSGASPVIANNVISYNVCPPGGGGGGIRCYDACSPIIRNNVITQNEPSGIDIGNSNPIISNCTFSDNIGFGIACSQSSPLLTNCTFIGNSEELGGGMSISESKVMLLSCRFIGNSAEYWGGGLYCSRESNLTLVNCIFSGNLAGERGGGMYVYGYASTTTVAVGNCTFVGNYAPDGNGLACHSHLQAYPSEVHVGNCILYNGGNEIWNNDGSAITINYSDIEGGEPSCYDPCDMIEWGLGNIDVDPCFVEPGKWVDVNEPNIVVEPNDSNAVWVDGDYHLKSEGWRLDMSFDPPRWRYDYVTSRCIDADNPGSPLRNELLTIPGDPGHIWGENLRIDMGAYGGTPQASMPPYGWALLADITNDGLVNGSDFAHQATDWLIDGTEQPGDLNRNGIVDTNDVGLFVGDWLETTSWHE